MKLSTVKLLMPMIAVSIQANSATTVIPPYLDHMQIPVALIGTLISIGPVLALLSRLPVGMAYNHERARLVVSAAMIAMGLTNYLYSFATSPMMFAVIQGINGFAYGALTTLYMAFYVDSLAPDENRNHAMGYYVGSLAMGYSTGNFFGGLIADHWGYALTFQLGAFLSPVSTGFLWFLHRADSGTKSEIKKAGGKLSWSESLKALVEPELATV